MAGCINKVFLLGNVGSDPEIRTLNNGDRAASFRMAMTESWRDKATGDRKERTEWMTVTTFQDGLIKVITDYVKKGTKVHVEGELTTRKWTKDGQDHYTTEVRLGMRGALTLLGDPGDRKGGGRDDGPGDYDGRGSRDSGRGRGKGGGGSKRQDDDFDDAIPF